MKNISWLSICFAFLFSAEYAQAAYFSDYASHLVEIKTKPTITTAKAKPAFFYQKSAAVRFITDDGASVDFSCATGWEWINGRCEPKSCEGYPYSDVVESLNCLGTESCQSGNDVYYKCQECPENMQPDGNGGCKCNTSEYSYNSKDNVCLFEYDEMAGVCSEVSVAGAVKYYKDCVCPPSWVECPASQHLVGHGEVCRSGGKEYYLNCSCEMEYQNTCVTGEPVNSGDYCLNPADGVRYYESCYYCSLDEGEIYSFDEYWCGSSWIDFPVIGDLYSGE